MTRPFLALTVAVLLASCGGGRPETKQEPASKPQDTSVIEMGLEAQKHVGLKVAPASLAQLTEYLHVTGTVQPIDSRISHVRPLARGRVLEVLVQVGDRVRDGQPLARFDNIEAGELLAQHQSAQAELQKLQIQQAAFQRQLERTRRLVEIGAAPRKEAEQFEAEHRALLAAIRAQESSIAGLAARLRRFGLPEPTASLSSVTSIASPFAGVVIKAQAAPGEVLEPGAELFSVANMTEVWVQAEVYEKDLGRIHVGQTAFVSVDTYPAERFPGKVTYISDILDPQTRTAKVRCEVSNQGFRLKLDMFAAVDVPTTFSRKAVAAPTGAIQQIEGKNVVFVRRSDDKFEARPVKIGKVVDGQTEIVAGLAGGEPIVVQGAFHLKSIAMGEKLREEE